MGSTLFRCECHGHHFFEVLVEPDGDHSLWINFWDQPVSFWQLLKNWWHNRKMWWAEVLITPNDARELRDKLNEYLEKT